MGKGTLDSLQPPTADYATGRLLQAGVSDDGTVADWQLEPKQLKLVCRAAP
jgi:hypothetical protein